MGRGGRWWRRRDPARITARAVLRYGRQVSRRLLVTEMRIRETPTTITTTIIIIVITELQVRLVIKTPSETMRAPRTLTVLLPLLAVTSPAIGAETTKVPVIRQEVRLQLRMEVRLEVRFEVRLKVILEVRLEVSPPPAAGCCRSNWEHSWSRRKKVRQELPTTINIRGRGLPPAIFSAISSLLKLPYFLLSVNNKALLSILNLSFLWGL